MEIPSESAICICNAKLPSLYLTPSNLQSVTYICTCYLYLPSVPRICTCHLYLAGTYARYKWHVRLPSGRARYGEDGSAVAGRRCPHRPRRTCRHVEMTADGVVHVTAHSASKQRRTGGVPHLVAMRISVFSRASISGSSPLGRTACPPPRPPSISNGPFF